MTTPDNTPPPPDRTNPQLQQAISQAVAKRVEELKTKNSQLLDQLRQQQSRLKPWEGFNPHQVKTVMQRLNESEDARLIAEGRLDEVVSRRVEANEQRLAQVRRDADAASQEAQHYRRQYIASSVDNAVANTLHGLHDGALSSAQLMVRDWFTVTDKGAIAPTEQAPITASGPLRLEDLQGHLQKTMPFLFQTPGSPSNRYISNNYAPTLKKSQMSSAEKADYIRKHGGDAYRHLTW
jgi:hypothetical protein